MTYVVERMSDAACRQFTARLNQHRISGSLAVTPEPHQSKGLRASGLKDCMRQAGYRLLGIAETDDTYNPDNRLSADMGTAIHVRIQQQLVGAGMVYRHGDQPAIELVLQDVAAGEELAQIRRWTFTGHIDAVLEDNNGDLSIFDLKTAKADLLDPAYEYLPGKLQEYAVQVMSYMFGFCATDGRRARTAWVYMISRADPRVRALYRIPWQPERWAHDAGRIDAASRSVRAGALPQAEPERGGCRFCGWRTRCKDGRGE